MGKEVEVWERAWKMKSTAMENQMGEGSSLALRTKAGSAAQTLQQMGRGENVEGNGNGRTLGGKYPLGC